jgi:hypothetical protein
MLQADLSVGSAVIVIQAIMQLPAAARITKEHAVIMHGTIRLVLIARFLPAANPVVIWMNHMVNLWMMPPWNNALHLLHRL